MFADLEYRPPRLIENAGSESLSNSAWLAWATKHRTVLFPKWLAQLPSGHQSDPAFQQMWRQVSATLTSGWRDDEANWGGWAARHGGVVEHLGDRVAGASGQGVDWAALVFALFFLALLTALARQAMEAAPAVAQAPAPAAVKRRGKPARARRAQR